MDEKPLTLDKAISDARATAEMTRKDGWPEVAEVWDQFVGWLEELREKRELLSKSVRVEMVDFDDGERGCRFIVGEKHVVAEWRGDGIAADTIFVEEPALTYFKTTTPLDRCVRMALEMCHWEVACAMLAGPGDGNLVEWAERYEKRVSGELKLCPFCGGTVVMESGPRFDNDPECKGPDSKWHAVRCRSCATQGPWAKSESGAARWWNMRAGEGEDE